MIGRKVEVVYPDRCWRPGSSWLPGMDVDPNYVTLETWATLGDDAIIASLLAVLAMAAS